MNNQNNHNIVIPSLQGVPERLYKRSGSLIKCYVIPNWRKPYDHSPNPLFEFDMGTSKNAEIMLEDMYIGEDTGP